MTLLPEKALGLTYMAKTLDARINEVRDALHRAGKDLPPEEWIELCEVISTDCDSFAEAAREEMEEAEE